MEQLPEIERLKLLKRRKELENQIVALNAQPPGKSEASKTFRKIDLQALARKMVLIDKKLGRNPV